MPNLISSIHARLRPVRAAAGHHERVSALLDKSRRTSEHAMRKAKAKKRLPPHRTAAIKMNAVAALTNIILAAEKERELMRHPRTPHPEFVQSSRRMTSLVKANANLVTSLKRLEESGAVPKSFTFQCNMDAKKLFLARSKNKQY